jgi:hypothetical protein
MRSFTLLLLSTLTVMLFAGCDNRTQVASRLESVDNMVAYWDFASDDFRHCLCILSAYAFVFG